MDEYGCTNNEKLGGLWTKSSMWSVPLSNWLADERSATSALTIQDLAIWGYGDYRRSRRNEIEKNVGCFKSAMIGCQPEYSYERISNIPDVDECWTALPYQDLVLNWLVAAERSKDDGWRVVIRQPPHCHSTKCRESVREVRKWTDGNDMIWEWMWWLMAFTWNGLKAGRWT